MGLPCGGPRQRAPRVHQHTPAVTSGLVALHWLIEPPRGTLRDDNALTGILPGLFQGTLSLLVTRVDFLCKRRHSLCDYLFCAQHPKSRAMTRPSSKELMAWILKHHRQLCLPCQPVVRGWEAQNSPVVISTARVHQHSHQTVSAAATSRPRTPRLLLLRAAVCPGAGISSPFSEWFLLMHRLLAPGEAGAGARLPSEPLQGCHV